MITCFLITASDRAWRFLRRYTYRDGQECPATGGRWGHMARVEIEPAPLVLSERGSIPSLDWPRDDPRWPTHCAACGYVFQPGDPWSCDQHEIYLTPDGREVSIHLSDAAIGRAAPAGAMWQATWIPAGDDWTGPDGKCYYLRLPDGTDWMIDGPARNGPGWTRTGEPPRITARPSIASPGYHGWLTDGVLSADLEGRIYPVLSSEGASTP